MKLESGICERSLTQVNGPSGFHQASSPTPANNPHCWPSHPRAEDVALIESLEESKRVATDISDKVAEARETESAINDSRNK